MMALTPAGSSARESAKNVTYFRPSLLLEWFDIQPIGEQTHAPMDQVLAPGLKPAVMQHVTEERSVPEIPAERGEPAVSMRNRNEALRWKQPASALRVRAGDMLDEAAPAFVARDCVDKELELRMCDPRMRSLLYALEVERAYGYSSGRLFIDSIEKALAALLAASASKGQAKTNTNKNGLSPQRLRRVLELMRASIGRQITLTEFAKCAGLSASHFSQQFKTSLNMSPYKYMLNLRIAQSKKMLRNPHMSILDVSLATGFENQQHFATVFRRMVGVTPSDFRRKL